MRHAGRRAALAAELVYYGLLAALAVRFCDIYVKPRAFDPGTSPVEVAEGVAALPIQYRILSPLLIDAWASLTGLSFYTAAALYTAVALFAALVALDRLVLHFTGSAVLARAAGAGAVLPLLTLFDWLEHSRLYAASDVPALLVTALGLLLLVKRRYLWFSAVFTLGTLNRETTYLLLFALVFLEGPRPRTLLLAGGLAVWWIAAKAALALLFAGQPPLPVPGGIPVLGGLAVLTLGTNLKALLAAGEDLVYLPTLFGGALLPVILFWRDLPEEMRRLLLAASLQFAVLLAFALVFELRVYVELVPFVWTALFVVAQARLRREPAQPAAAGDGVDQRGGDPRSPA